MRFRSALKVRPKKYIQYPTRNWPLKDHPELQIKPRWLEVPKLPEFFQRGDFTEMFFKSPLLKSWQWQVNYDAIVFEDELEPEPTYEDIQLH